MKAILAAAALCKKIGKYDIARLERRVLLVFMSGPIVCFRKKCAIVKDYPHNNVMPLGYF
jgi:hypothetical protein